MKHLRLAIVILALLVPSVIAQPANDAGTGADAPNAEEDLFMIPAGTFVGQLRKNDSDWYTSFDGSGSLACVTLEAASDITADAKLVVRDGGARRVMRTTIGPGSPARLAQAASSLGDARIGFENALDPGPDRGNYGFSIATRVISEFTTDGNTGADAPSEVAGAPLVNAGCIGGRLGLFDTRDVYRFGGAAGDITVLTFAAPSDARLDLLADDGSVLASVLGGQRAAVTLPQSGTYSMAASASGVSNLPYMIGTAMGPPGQGCRPACLST